MRQAYDYWQDQPGSLGQKTRRKIDTTRPGIQRVRKTVSTKAETITRTTDLGRWCVLLIAHSQASARENSSTHDARDQVSAALLATSPSASHNQGQAHETAKSASTRNDTFAQWRRRIATGDAQHTRRARQHCAGANVQTRWERPEKAPPRTDDAVARSTRPR